MDAIKDLSRLRDIAITLSKHGFGHVLEDVNLLEKIGLQKEHLNSNKPSKEKAFAIRLKNLLTDLGPTFIKFGQIISTRPDLIPFEIAEQLTMLQDSCPPIDFSKIKPCIEKGLGNTIANLYESVNEKPLASASIAQVHTAITKNGDEVVIKVLRPGIKDIIYADMDILYWFAGLFEAFFDESGQINPTEMVDELQYAIKQELDFTHELKNLTRFYDNNKGREYLIIPKPYNDLSCKTILTMEMLKGKRLRDITNTEEKKDIALKIIEGGFQQLFTDRFFHGDPHPGNLLITDDHKIAVFDFGLAGEVTDSMQTTLVLLVVGVALKDPDTVARIFYKLGIPSERINLHEFKSDILQLMDSYLDLELDNINAKQILQQFMEIAVKYKIKIPREYTVLVKSSITIEGIVRNMYPDLDILDTAMPYVRKLMSQKFDITQLSGNIMKMVLQANQLMKEIPEQLQQILMDLESGRLRIQTENPQFEKISEGIFSAGLITFYGLIASSLIIGSFFVLADFKADFMGVPIIALIGFILAGAMVGGVLVYYALLRKLRKFKLFRHIGLKALLKKGKP